MARSIWPEARARLTDGEDRIATYRPAGGVAGPVHAVRLRCVTGAAEQAAARDVPLGCLAQLLRALGKLGAANRTEAVARARQLALIP